MPEGIIFFTLTPENQTKPGDDVFSVLEGNAAALRRLGQDDAVAFDAGVHFVRAAAGRMGIGAAFADCTGLRGQGTLRGKSVVVSDVVAQGPIAAVSGRLITIRSRRNNPIVSQNAATEAKERATKVNVRVVQ